MQEDDGYPVHFPLRSLDRDAPAQNLLAPEYQQRRIAFWQVLYRFYDRDLRPLYIGITTIAGARLDAHRKRSLWWSSAEYVAISVYDRNDPIREFERAAIHAEQPRFNRASLRGVKTAKVQLHGDPEEAAAVLFREATPDFIAALAGLLAQPDRFPQPAPPPPARFAEEVDH